MIEMLIMIGVLGLLGSIVLFIAAERAARPGVISFIKIAGGPVMWLGIILVLVWDQLNTHHG